MPCTYPKSGRNTYVGITANACKSSDNDWCSGCCSWKTCKLDRVRFKSIGIRTVPFTSCSFLLHLLEVSKRLENSLGVMKKSLPIARVQTSPRNLVGTPLRLNVLIFFMLCEKSLSHNIRVHISTPSISTGISKNWSGDRFSSLFSLFS